MSFLEFEKSLFRLKLEEETAWSMRLWAKKLWSECLTQKAQNDFALAHDTWVTAHRALSTHQALRPPTPINQPTST